MLNKTTLLDLIRHFTVFEKVKTVDPETEVVNLSTIKKIGAYHQYYAVNKAVESVLRACSVSSSNSSQVPSSSSSQGEENRSSEASRPLGERFGEREVKQERGRGGVIWHTQGSGKSLSMVFLCGKLVLALDNPTLVILTDRNDLDDQLFDTFAGCRQLLRQEPQQADNRTAVRNLLNVASGGIVFTTVQKFSPEEGETLYPTLSNRSNIVVLADEAHRSQYGFKAKQVTIKDASGNEIGQETRYGFAKYIRDALPNATFVGFTGTPIEQTDKNTPEIFGDYIDIYDIAQAVEDGAIVPIYYESRLVKVELNERGRELLDELDDDLSGEDLSDIQRAKAKQTQLEAIVGASQRLATIADDIVTHFAQRQTANRGKGMIVTLSRKVAANLYDQIIHLRPDWHSDNLNNGKLKVVMTASAADAGNLPQHHTSKRDRQILAQRLKDPDNELELVIVCDMWLTGFDAPCLHTLYIDKPMKGHNLMQAIARINRVYFEKQGGLVVDYLGIAHELKQALNFYSNSGGKGNLTLDQEVAIGLMLKQLEVVEGIMAGFDHQPYFTASTGDKLSLLKAATNYAANPQIKERFRDAIAALSIVLVARIRKNASIDWNLKESVRARMKVMVKRLLRKYGYPPDMQAMAIELVLEQAKVFAEFEVKQLA